MSVDLKPDLQLEVAHVLLIDAVGYSKLLIDEQREVQQQLSAVVRSAEEVQAAEAQGKLLRLPTGDGVALVFSNTQEAPVRCAVQITEALSDFPQLKLRMGIHTGPVSSVADVNERTNVAGAGINIAQRVMDCGDAGHILLSKRAADDLAQYRRWQPYLHDLGQVEVKHGVKIDIVNLYSDKVGNARVPAKVAEANKKQTGARRRKRGLITAAILLAVLLPISVSIFLRSRARDTLARMLADKSIAVLPFDNMSEDKANAFFADGMQDEVLTDLAKVAALKVISRSSVMQYKNSAGRNLREIAQQLGVAHILEGSVQRAANRIRVSAQLIDARNDAHLWAEHYDRDLADVFAVQSEIATSIVEQLRAKLSPAEKSAIEEKPTSDLVAYDLYLRAKALGDEISTSADWEGDNRRLVELLDRAVTQDPNFARAYCELYQWNLNLYDWVDRTPARLARAEAALKQAERIAPEAGDTLLARANESKRNGDFDRASQLLEAAAKVLPGNVDLLLSRALIERRRGHWSEVVRDWEKARELDPKSPNIPNGLCDLYYALRDYTKSDQVADAAIAAFPKGPGYFLAAKVHNALARGDNKAARVALAKLPAGWNPSGITSLLQTEVAVADRNYAEVAQLSKTRPQKDVIAEIGVDISFMEAMVARRQSDTAREQSILTAMRKEAESDSRNRPEDHYIFSRLGLIDAYLGRKEDGLREAEKAVELRPIAHDAVAGPQGLTLLAEVCMLTGDRDRAIHLLSEVATIPYGPSYGDLVSPSWDALRGDPRFQTIVAAAKSASR